MTRLIAVAIIAMGWTTATMAQGTISIDQLNRASQQRQQQAQNGRQQPRYNDVISNDSHAFSTLYLEYNPTTMHASYKGHTDNTSYQGLSLGYSYFTPFYGNLGVDFGAKLQYFFRNETKGASKYKSNMFSVTIPVDLAYDWRVTEGFAVYPYAGLYARVNITANGSEEIDGKKVADYNAFDKDDMGDDTWNRFQFGWQAGVNFRFTDVVTVGGGYWMDLNELTDHMKLYGFNITVGINF